jgi:hypothetical protein
LYPLLSNCGQGGSYSSPERRRVSPAGKPAVFWDTGMVLRFVVKEVRRSHEKLKEGGSSACCCACGGFEYTEVENSELPCRCKFLNNSPRLYFLSGA